MSEELMPLNNLDPDERDWIIKQIALRRKLPEIKRDFDYVFAPKIVTGREILDIELLYPDRIADEFNREMSNIAANSLAHVRLRMDCIELCLQEAMEKKPIRSVKVPGDDGEDGEWKVVEGMDHQAVARYLGLAQSEEYLAKRMLLEIRKLDIDVPDARRSGFKPIKVNIGDFDDAEVVTE